jgi:outer membrane receptor protein involved in Fe transport
MCAASIAVSTALEAQTKAAEPATKSEETNADTLQLSPFAITGERDSGYGSNRTMSGSRSSKSLIEIPTAIGLINKEVIDDLAAVDVHEILRFGVSGVTQNQTIGDDVNIRGFRTNGSLRNGTPQLSGTHVNTLYDIERAEVIKGPASMVLGGSSTAVGGAVNYITIKPTAMQTSEAQVSFSNLNYVRFAANTMGPLYQSKDLKALYRVTLGGVKGDRDKIIENEDEKFLGGALSLYFGQNTSVDFTAYVFQNTGYRYWDDFLDVSNNGTVNNWTPSTTALGIAKLNQYSTKSASPFRRKDAGFHNVNQMLELTFLTKLTTNSNLRIYLNQAKINDVDLYSRGITMQQDNYTMNRQDIPEHDEYARWFYQLDYMHHLALKFASFDTMLGADAQIQQNHSQLSVNDATNGGPAPLDMRAPDYAADDAYFAKAMPGRGLPNLSNNSSRVQTVTKYVQENVSFWKDRIILVGGLRWFSPSGTRTNLVTNVITTDAEIETKVHKYGAVLRILPWLSGYYTDAENVQVQIGLTDKFKANDQLGPPLQNQRGINKEFGLKADYPISKDVRFYGSVAHFKMALTNVRTFGDLGNGVEGIIQSAQDSSSGWEADSGVSIKLGEGKTDLIATWFDGDSFIAANRAVQAQGFVGTKYSLMAKYTWLTTGRLNGTMVGFGYENQTGKRNGNFYMPAYSVTDLFARYNISKKLSVQLNLSNIGNKRIIIAQAASALVQTLDPMRTRVTFKYSW